MKPPLASAQYTQFNCQPVGRIKSIDFHDYFYCYYFGTAGALLGMCPLCVPNLQYLFAYKFL